MENNRLGQVTTKDDAGVKNGGGSIMTKWTFTSAEILKLLRDAHLEPWLGSPLRRLGHPTQDSATSLTKTNPEMLEALSRIARPEVVLGLINYPPEEPEFSWFYGASGGQRFALYQEEDVDGYHVTWPINGQDLFEAVQSSLVLDQRAVNQEISFLLDRNGFETMAAIIDIIQEDALVALLNRMPTPVSRFDAVSLMECCYRTLHQTDLRWMVYRVKFISPTDFVPSLQNISAGLESLREKNLLVQNGHQYSPTKRLGLICSLMSACNGFCGLSTRRRVAQPVGESVWDQQHIVALRGMDSLWLLEFTDITSEDFAVKVSDVTSSQMRDRLHAGLLISKTQGETPPVLKAGPVTKPALTLEVSMASSSPPSHRPSSEIKAPTRIEVHCPKCGATLSPDSKFCTRCGSPVGRVESPPPQTATPVPSHCSKCGAKLSMHTKFCTNCGSSVAQK